MNDRESIRAAIVDAVAKMSKDEIIAEIVAMHRNADHARRSAIEQEMRAIIAERKTAESEGEK